MSALAPQGDEATLFQQYNARLLRAVSRVVNASDALIEDACATAWTQLIRTQPERGPALFAWLRTVAIHEAYRLCRADRREAALEELSHPAGEGWQEMIEAPVDLELQIEARRALAAVGDLRPRQRRYLALFAAGYTYEEIAELSGATYTNVNKHLTRARAGVRGLQAAV